MPGESWWQTQQRLDREGRRMNWPERLVLLAGFVVGFLGQQALTWTRELFPSPGWWVAALGGWMVVFFAGEAYLFVWMVGHSRRRRRRLRRATT